MLILTIRTDNPLAEIGLFDDHTRLAYESWQAHRQLGATIHEKIRTLLQSQHKSWQDLRGVVAYEGPGSFTGLRIGLSVANTLSASYKLKAIGTTGDAWVQAGIDQLLTDAPLLNPILPEYGAPVHITAPKK